MSSQYRFWCFAGREIWEQSEGLLDAFVCGAGTGGTIAGVSKYLKSKKAAVQVVLVDPPGSSLHNKVFTPRHSNVYTKRYISHILIYGYAAGNQREISTQGMSGVS